MAISNTQSSGSNSLIVVLIVAVIAILAVGAVYLMQDNRSGSERVGDAIEAAPHGLDKAADQLGDQPPAKNVERNLEKATN
ncbi:MAG: hypothetical protein QM647_07420 [Asticcacaulis sp.]|uniref:hypothetical protein n=1 Tax=Asticcacaulis sp. TaxID=1872648 RepID=UPI0039E3D694